MCVCACGNVDEIVCFFVRFDEEGLNEHAVDDPEEVARMVEMWVLCFSLPLFIYLFIFKFKSAFQ